MSEPQPVLLVADDEAILRKILRHYFEAVGWRVVGAADGVETLELVARESPDVILLDLAMPRLDGLEVARRLRNDPVTRDLPILLVTAHGQLRDKIAGLELANDYIVKPFEPSEIEARVNVALRLKRLQDELKLKNEELKQLIVIDDLTGMFNRRYALDRLNEELSRARRYGCALSCLLAEVDPSALPMTEAELRDLAEVLRDSTRMADFLARIDDARFLFILPNTYEEGAATLGVELQRAVNERTYGLQARSLSLRVAVTGVDASMAHDRAGLMATLAGVLAPASA